MVVVEAIEDVDEFDNGSSYWVARNEETGKLYGKWKSFTVLLREIRQVCEDCIMIHAYYEDCTEITYRYSNKLNRFQYVDDRIVSCI